MAKRKYSVAFLVVVSLTLIFLPSAFSQQTVQPAPDSVILDKIKTSADIEHNLLPQVIKDSLTEGEIDSKVKSLAPSPPASSNSSSAVPGSSSNIPGGGGSGGGTSSLISANGLPELIFNQNFVQVNPQTGSAGFNIPIEVPAGRNGVQPSLSIAYNSSVHNSLAGVGWDLELGTIERSTKNGVPTYNNNTDTFIVKQATSSQELVSIGSGQYRPEIEGEFLRYQYDSGNNKWIITDRKGTKFYFGSTLASRIDKAPGQTYQWALDSVEDIHTNYMTISYLKEQNRLYPDQILYTGNHLNNILPYARVVFICGYRNDSMFSYASGMKVWLGRILNEIEVHVGNNLQRRYILGHRGSSVTGRNVLEYIAYYGSQNDIGLWALRFQYQDSPVNGYQQATNWSIPSGAIFSSTQGTNGRMGDTGVRVIDVNGDAFPDLVKAHEYHGSPQVKVTYLHNKVNGWSDQGTWALPGAIKPLVNTAPEIDREWGVRMGDINGDGWVDLIRHFKRDPYWGGGGFVSNEVYLSNQNNGWNLAPNWQMPSSDEITVERGQPQYGYHYFIGTVLADLNADGFSDYVRSKEGDYATHASHINRRTIPGWQGDGNWSTPTSAYTDMADGAAFSDLNGDNLPDIFYRKSGNSVVYLNTGYGFVLDSNSMWNNLPNYGDFSDGSTQLADMNGDGLDDIVISSSSAGQTVLRNTDDGWVIDNRFAITGDFTNLGTRLIDANADGMMDYMIYTHNSGPSLYLNQVKYPDLLTEVNNGIGGITKIEYDTSATQNNTFLPFIVPVVKSLEARDGLRVQSYQTRYEYRNGLYNTSYREFRGFGFVKTIDPQNNYIETHFAQDDLYKGRVQRQLSYDSSGNLFNKTENTWSSQQIYPGVNFVKLDRTDSYVYDSNSSGLRKAAIYQYDAFGNPTRVEETGWLNAGTGSNIDNDLRVTETEYHNNTNLWLLGFPKHVRVLDFLGAVNRESWMYYDNNPNVNDLPVRGLLTKKEDWAGTGNINPIIQYTYDAFGNLRTTLDSRNFTTSINYEPQYQLFPLSTTNALNHQIVNEFYGVNGVSLNSGDGYRGLWGQVKSKKDPNNQIERKTYDQYGRLTAQVGPLDTVGLPTFSYEYLMTTNHMRIKTRARIEHGLPETQDSSEFYDGLGRLFERKFTLEQPNSYVITEQARYNANGSVSEEYAPYTTSNDLNTIDSIDPSKPHSTIQYDAVGRQARITGADGTFSTFLYDDWWVQTIDENGHMKKSYADAFGRIIMVEEYLGADGRGVPEYPTSPFTLYATTRYVYDTEGSLLRTVDNQSNQTIIFYDKLGRKVQTNDPDMGVWQYHYDANGNMDWQIDSKNQRLDFIFDALNRMTNKRSGTVLNVNYIYDDPAVPFSKGRLTEIQEVNGGSRLFYDAVGNVIRTQKIIDNTTYEVNRSYDGLNRIEDLRYPDNHSIRYEYNSAGEIEKIYSDNGNQQNYPLVHLKANDNAANPTVVNSGTSGVHLQSSQNTSALSQLGVINRALFLNTDTINLQPVIPSIRNDQQGSLAFWVKVNGTGSSQAILRLDNSGVPAAFALDVLTAGNSYQLQVAATSNGLYLIEALIPVTFNGGQWYHIVLVQDGVDLKPYVNGIAYAAQHHSTRSPVHSAWLGDVLNLNIGSIGFNSFVGRIDDFRYYQRVLTSAEVGALYNNGLGTEASDPGSTSSVTNFINDVDYNQRGQMTHIEYGNGITTDYTYNIQNSQLTNIVSVRNGTQTIQNLSYQFDKGGNITAITDGVYTANQTFGYDALDRLIQASGQRYGNRTYQYNTIGNIIQKDGNTYTYSGVGAGPHAVTGLSSGETFTYDTNGNMTQRTQGSIVTGYEYDREDRLIRVRKRGVIIAEYWYDQSGQRFKKIDYRFVNPGWYSCFLPGTKILMSDGSVKSIEHIKASEEVSGYDGKSIKTVPAKVKAAIAEETNEYLILNHELKVTAEHPFFTEGEYKTAGELKVGDKLLKSDFSEIQIESIEKIKSETPLKVYNIDVEGVNNYFVSMSSSTSSAQDFVLVHNKAAYYPLYQPNQQMITRFVESVYEEDNITNRRTDYISLGSTRTAAITTTGGAEKFLYYHNDHLGSVNLLTDRQGQLKELIEYMPFGEFSRRQMFGGSPDEVAWYYFTGKMLDDETGLIYFGARYYDPRLGRFITADTLIQEPYNPQTLNRYTYASNNPVNLIDPDGHGWWKKFKQRVLPHIINFARIVHAVFEFPVNPIGSTLEIASVIASYTDGGDSAKVSQILSWSAQGWDVGQGVYYGLNPQKDLVVVGKGGVPVKDYNGFKRVGVTGVGNTEKSAGRLISQAAEKKGVRYDAIILNKSHGSTSDLIECGIGKFTGSKVMAQRYHQIITEITSVNPGIVFDVHSEATIFFTRAAQIGPLGSMGGLTYMGPAVLQSTAENALNMVANKSGSIFRYTGKFFDPVASGTGTLNPFRLTIGTAGGIGLFAAPHSFVGYLPDLRQ